MSKIGKKPINIPDGVKVEIKENTLITSGPKGELKAPLLGGVVVEVKEEDKTIEVSLKSNNAQSRMNWGTVRSLIQNTIVGVTDGYSKTLEINGVGYRAEMQGDTLVLKVGFSHPVNIKSPKGIEINVEGNKVKVSGIDKELVGQVAANIRKTKKPEPYLGKGIKYEDEVIRRKVGKRATGAAA